MVKVITATKLEDLKGNETGMTVGQFLSEVLWNSRKNQSMSYVLAKKFTIEEEVELKAEEIAFIKEVINTVGARAGEAGQVIELLDPATTK